MTISGGGFGAFPLLAGTGLTFGVPELTPVWDDTETRDLLADTRPDLLPIFSEYRDVAVVGPSFAAMRAGGAGEDEITNSGHMPAPANCAGTVATVAFDFASTTVSEADKAALSNSLSSAENCPSTMLVVRGHADSVGNGEANKALSLKRSLAVEEAISQTKPSIATVPIQLQAWGENLPQIDTGNDVESAANRMAQVSLVNSICSGNNDILGSLAEADPLDSVSQLPALDSDVTGMDRIIYVVRHAGTSNPQSNSQLSEIANAVAAHYMISPSRVFPINAGPDCLELNESVRIDVIN